MGVQDRLDDVLQPRALPHDLVAPCDVAAQRLGRFIGDPDLRQKAAGVKLRQDAGIDRVGFDFGASNEIDLLGIGNHHPGHVRADHRRY